MSTADPVEEYQKVETAKALLAIRSVTTPEQFENIRNIVLPGNAAQHLDNAVSGLSKEDEFAMMCKIMGTATHMVHLEQRPIIPGDYQAPDFMARFQPGCFMNNKSAIDSSGYRCLIEVKSTKKMKYKVSGSRLRWLRNFAKEFGLPLIIAVRFLKFGNHALWVMILDDDPTQTAINITPADLAKSVRHVLWNEYMYMPIPDLIAEYVLRPKPFPGISHEIEGAGYLHEARYHSYARNIHVSVVGVEAMMTRAFLEVFQPKEVHRKNEADAVHICYENSALTCFVSDLLFYFNRLPSNEKGETTFDPSRILAGMDTLLITRELTDAIAGMFFRENLMGYVTIGEDEVHINKWLALGGRA